jgi:hypothetical protein
MCIPEGFDKYLLGNVFGIMNVAQFAICQSENGLFVLSHHLRKRLIDVGIVPFQRYLLRDALVPTRLAGQTIHIIIAAEGENREYSS